MSYVHAHAPVYAGAASDSNVDRKGLRRVILGASAGTIFEAYDFILFGSLAPIISRHFFSAVNETTAFVFALLTFAVGFAVRPLGALIFGRIGDRAGRKRAFIVTITLMGLSTFGIGMLPTYEAVGVLAPVALIVLRMIQGLAYGGEYGGAIVYAAEYAPQGQRGLYVGWIQAAAGFALFMSFLVIFVTRTATGEQSFEEWGWRVPFLISIGLLVISLRLRLTLEESPMFRKLLEEGRNSRRPLTEAFLSWPNLKLVLLVLFGLTAVQGVLFYTAHFYSQFFLVQILRVDGATVTFVLMIVTAISVPLYVFFSWLSDRIGRRRIIAAGMVLAAITTIPLFRALTEAANPQLAAAQLAAPITVVADPRECSVQFDPIGRNVLESSCDIAKSLLSRRGVVYVTEPASPAGGTVVRVGSAVVAGADTRDLSAAAATEARRDFQARVLAALAAAGYPERADSNTIDTTLVMLIVMVMVVLAVMVYAPMAAMAIEIFPTRIRYSAVSLPFHIGSGWFGGFLPAIAFAVVIATGDIYAGLWYPVAVTVIGAAILILFLVETKHRDIR